ncbi:MAG: hypothetical protein BWX88_05185 [Planctomycetes bacterium ADurb.Bin126]|nr:MAG: hypothetical protein BWX88_05185 [Planctomycetes bacterium ADurb.Bin126]HOD84865.1 hypothetical protein [Phycisphaerae bacterium]HQL76508.1 hypothetical protein [Phycisphaerae bacterium]
MNNVILRKINVTGSWQPLSAARLIGSVTIATPPANAGNVLFRNAAEPTQEVAWVPGEWYDFYRIGLSEIEVKGSVGDAVTVVGGTW